MPRKGSRQTIAPGIYRDSRGIGAIVRVGSGDHERRQEKRYPLDTPLEIIQRWQRRTRGRLLAGVVTTAGPARGTLSADIDRYLATIPERRRREERAHQLDSWRQALGPRYREAITSVDLRTVLAAWQTPPPGSRRYAASTLNHRLTALRKLYAVLDADDADAPNPLLKVRKVREPEPTPREIPWGFILAIFAAMPTTRHRRKLTHAQALEVHAATRRGPGTYSAVARLFRVSEALVRRLADHAPSPDRDTAATSRARLWLMATTGLPPRQIMHLRPEHVDGDAGAVWTTPRRKGRGTKGDWVPVTPTGLEALRTFFAVGADGPFSPSGAGKVWHRAIGKVKAQYAAEGRPLPDLPPTLRPYDLRHSFLTRAYRASKDRRAVQKLGLHANPVTTDRYTLGAVEEGAKVAIAKMARAEADFEAAGNTERGTKANTA